VGDEPSPPPVERREATVREARALAHPLRLRILRLCAQHEMTNKQLADRLDRDPGTVLYHVRQLAEAGFVEPGPVRTGTSGALERPYRATSKSWWLSNSLARADPDSRLAPIQAFQEELHEAGADAVRTLTRFVLHLSPDEAAELDRRICAVIDEYVLTEDRRREQPAHGGIVVVHRLAD
jgi:DNA-binding transcriptional ArsR family regulator